MLLSQTPGLTAAQAVEILQTHADDGGAPGPDSCYGYGTLDLGWALAREDLSRTDVAISSHHYNAETGAIEVVVQNRSAVPAGAFTLTVELNNRVTTYPLSVIAPGCSTTVALPLDAATSTAPIILRTRLSSLSGITDAVPGNNTRDSRLDLGR